MRTGITNLPTPHPIRERLPGVYLDDDFTVRLTGAFDAVLAPVMAVLDCFASYLDPMLAPADFVGWLAGWVACPADESSTLAQRREMIARAVELHRWRGTARGLAEQLRLLTGGEVEVTDSGRCEWSAQAGGPVPGSSPAEVTARVRAPDARAVDAQRLRRSAEQVVPAHVPVAIEVVPAGTRSSRPGGTVAGDA